MRSSRQPLPNPFNYTEELNPEHDILIGREKDLQELNAALRNHTPTLLLGRRNVGKSSLLNFANDAAQEQGYKVVSVDCRFATSVELFYQQLVTSLRAAKLWNKVQDHLQALEAPSVEQSGEFGLDKVIKATKGQTKKYANYERTETRTSKLLNVFESQIGRATSELQ